jgi:hypothetical protein
MSPVFIREKGYKFLVHSNEESRTHIHVEKGENECKFWMEPKIELSENCGFKAFEINEIKKIIENYEVKFRESWNKHFC